jgi:methyl-accepting chemotaxis protein
MSRWLDEMARTRDLLSPAPVSPDNASMNVLERFVRGLRLELIEFREIVDAAAGVADLNGGQLAKLVASTSEQRAIVENTAAAIADVDRSALHVARMTDGLRAVTASMAASTAGYDGGIGRVLATLQQLRTTIDEAGAFAAATENGTSGIVAFLDRLRRIARQARLLAINAAIEAAHLGDLGRGFVIVADQIKALSTSTAESARDVAAIHTDLHAASARVERAIGEATRILDELERDLRDVQAGSARAQTTIGAIDHAIGDVATIASEQSASLSSIATGVDDLARFADEISASAERAARLALGTAIEELKSTIGRYRLGERTIVDSGADDLAGLPPDIRAAAERLRAQVDADQREMLTAINRIAVSIARNSYEWKAIATSLDGLQRQLEATSGAIEETSAGADLAGAATRRMRASLDAMRTGFGASVDELQSALERVGRLRDTVLETDASVVATMSSAEKAAELLDLIDMISSETTLLSFNAAIESAHAGDAGSGFGIIADEIRSLAEGTSQSTQQIATVIAAIADASRGMRATSGSAGRQAAAIQTDTADVQAAIGDLRAELGTTFERASEVAGVVDRQLAALADIRQAAESATKRVRSDSAAATDSRRIELAMLGTRAHALAARRPLGTVAEELRAIGMRAAEQMDGIFEAAIDAGAIRLEDCFDTDYQPIVGARIAELGRLFDVSRVPPTGFDPPKFSTRYDRAVEDGFNALIDATVPTHPAIGAMIAVDLNGYNFGHYRECRQAWTGDYERDLANNRIKRFFDDELSLRLTRIGLGPAAESLPPRTPYARFRELGCVLDQVEPRPWAIFVFARDTGIVYNDLSIALFARKKRVGTIRMIYNADVV